ncbi:MAG: hypothetical protein LC749_19435, partial [Actinobacteria bacterium]|nr:hypothetical protein [Actinomycetota bacterium]
GRLRAGNAPQLEDFSNNANPNLVAPVLFAKRSRSLPSSVQHTIGSSGSHTRRIKRACRSPRAAVQQARSLRALPCVSAGGL